MSAALSQSKLSFRLLFILSSFSSAFFLKDLARSKPQSNPLLSELESLIEASQSGLDKTYEEDMKEVMVDISKSRKGDQRKSLSGKWELIYTTEKEINFFINFSAFVSISAAPFLFINWHISKIEVEFCCALV